MNKGFTKVEIIIMVSILAIFIIIGCVVVLGSSGECSEYRDLPLEKVPAKCVRYFSGSNNTYVYTNF